MSVWNINFTISRLSENNLCLLVMQFTDVLARYFWTSPTTVLFWPLITIGLVTGRLWCYVLEVGGYFNGLSTVFQSALQF